MSAWFVWSGLFLVGSNWALLPAIIYALKLRLIAIFTVLAIVFLQSSVYHLCQVDFGCVLDIQFEILRSGDHFFVYSALIWIAMYFIDLQDNYKIAVLLVFQFILLPLILQFVDTWWFSLVIIILLVVVIVALLLFVTKTPPIVKVPSLIVMLLLLAGGFVFFYLGGEPFSPDEADVESDSSKKYSTFHSLWHIAVMLSAWYAIDIKYGQSVIYGQSLIVSKAIDVVTKMKKKKTPLLPSTTLSSKTNSLKTKQPIVQTKKTKPLGKKKSRPIPILIQ